MKKIAFISDIHGNLEALKAVLADIEKRNIHIIYGLGDYIAKGIHAKECYELLKKHCQVLIAGNCDLHFSKEMTKENKDARMIFNHQLTTPNMRLELSQLPLYAEFYMSGRLCRVFHATQDQVNGFVVSRSSVEEKLKMFGPGKIVEGDQYADIVLYGHTHTPYFDRVANRTLINVGSVGNGLEIYQDENLNGNPLETVDATYFILEGDYQSKTWSTLSYQWVKVNYDIEKELANQKVNIEKEAYEKELRYGIYRDMHHINKA